MCNSKQMINGTQLGGEHHAASNAQKERWNTESLRRTLISKLHKSQQSHYDWASKQATRFALEQAKWASEYKAKMMRERSLRKWLGPVCLPMLLVLQPLTWYNLRTIFVLLILAFVVWIQYKRRRSSLKRAWVRGLERHCDKCMAVVMQQVKGADDQPASLRWDVRSWRKAPLRLLSRHWGNIANYELPPCALVIVLWFYSSLFSCKLKEAERESLWQYVSLGDFFTRRLKYGSRPLCPGADIVSPADGKVTFSGRFNGGFLQQVKGVHYSINYFLGLENSDGGRSRLHAANTDGYESLLMSKSVQKTSLFQCVIYLAPGDYHRFHSPATWTIEKRRHFPGELLSVKPGIVASFPGLFHLNERVAWLGRWRHGFFSLTAVGATNVGSIHADFEPDLRTNQAVALKRECTLASACSRRNFHFNERSFQDSPVEKVKGEEFGHFNFGSTIVLIFEAPEDFKFSDLENKGNIQVGQIL